MIPYGRKAAAIAREIRRAGTPCTEEQAESYIAAYHRKYPNVSKFLSYCGSCVDNPGYIDNPYGRRRRFVKFEEEWRMDAQRREAANFPYWIGEVKRDEFSESRQQLYSTICIVGIKG